MGNPVKLNEQKRTYHFANGEKVVIENVIELKVSDSGNHRLKSIGKKLHIIPPGWLHIEIDNEADWTI